MMQLTGVRVRLLSGPQQFSTSDTFSRFPVTKVGHFWGLGCDGNHFALLKKQTCRIIHDLLVKRKLNLSIFAYLQHTELRRATLDLNAGNLLVIANVDLNFFGRREDALYVGKSLTSFEICLQQPSYDLGSATYYNPHFFHLSEVFGQQVWETPFLPINENRGNEDGATQSSTKPSEEEQSAEDELDALLDSLSWPTYLTKQLINERIRTKLLTYGS